MKMGGEKSLAVPSTFYTKSFRFTLYAMCSVMSDSLWPHGLWPTRLLCPWNSPGRNTGVGCHFLLQGIFVTRENEPASPALQVDSVPLSRQGNPAWHHSKWYTFMSCLICTVSHLNQTLRFLRILNFFNPFYPQSRSCRASTVNVLTLQM